MLASSVETPLARKYLRLNGRKSSEREFLTKNTLGYSKANIDLLIRNGKLSNKNKTILVNQLKLAYPAKADWKNSDFDEGFSKYRFAERFELGFNETQKLLDEKNILLRKNYPFFTHELEVIPHIKTYQGLYYMFHMSPHTAKKRVLVRSTLRVRYVIGKKDKSCIRCKLNIPSIYKNRTNNFNYDGFLSVKNDRAYWVFESRENNTVKDYIQFATQVEPEEKNIFSGFYVSATQNSQLFASPVVLLKYATPNVDDAASIIEFMHNHQQLYFSGLDCLEPEFKKIQYLLTKKIEEITRI